MPLLSYSAITNFPFQPFTKILSSDTNLIATTIQTLLNVTKLDSLNVQVHGLTRKTSSSNISVGTANYVVINDSNGDFSDEAQLATSRGGLGFDTTPSGVAQAGYVPSVNAAGTGYQLAPAPATPGGNIFNFYNFS